MRFLDLNLTYCFNLEVISSFNNSIKFQRPIITEKRKEISQKSKDAFLAVIRVLEGLLANNDYFAGNEMSIADFSILPSVALASVRNRKFNF